MRRVDREKAMSLRLEGMSYSEIKRQVGVSKSVLSYWLSNYPLNDDQVNRLRERSEKKRVERYINTRNDTRRKRFDLIYEGVVGDVGKLSYRELLYCGICLYWGEGQKAGGVVSLSNTDPGMIVFYLNWLERCFGLNRLNGKIKYHLVLYSDMDISKELEFWSGYIGVPVELFGRCYVKKSKLSGINFVNFRHGTCRVVVGDVKIRLRILAMVKYLSSFFLGPSFNGSDRTLIKS